MFFSFDQFDSGSLCSLLFLICNQKEKKNDSFTKGENHFLSHTALGSNAGLRLKATLLPKPDPVRASELIIPTVAASPNQGRPIFDDEDSKE